MQKDQQAWCCCRLQHAAEKGPWHGFGPAQQQLPQGLLLLVGKQGWGTWRVRRLAEGCGCAGAGAVLVLKQPQQLACSHTDRLSAGHMLVLLVNVCKLERGLGKTGASKRVCRESAACQAKHAFDTLCCSKARYVPVATYLSPSGWRDHKNSLVATC